MDIKMSNVEKAEKNILIRNAPLAVILLAAAVGWFTLRDYISFSTLNENRDALLAFRDNHFLMMSIGFMAIYIVIVAFSLPGAAVASVTGGFLFGLAAGTAYNVFAATTGASAIFLAARWGLGQTLARKMDSSDGALKKIKRELAEHEISVLLLMRLVPVVPFFVANLIPAMVGVRFINFLWTTAIGIIPGAIVFTWIGAGLGEVFDRGENPDLSLIWEPQVIGPILGLCILAALPIAIKKIRGRRGF
ncbi:MAG: TVP38/TMEM64 family protein [Roseovarius sp.]|nr:TVP38/TMEM64 family protein [Roseovarius sp.]